MAGKGGAGFAMKKEPGKTKAAFSKFGRGARGAARGTGKVIAAPFKLAGRAAANRNQGNQNTTTNVALNNPGRGSSDRGYGFQRERGRLAAHGFFQSRPVAKLFFFNIIYFIFSSLGPLRGFWGYDYSIEFAGWATLFLWCIVRRSWGWFMIAFLMFVVVYASFFTTLAGELRTNLEGQDIDIGTFNPFERVKSEIYTTAGEWKNPTVEEKEPEKGVHFVNFVNREAFEVGEPVTVFGQVHIDGIDPSLGSTTQETTPITFSCAALDIDEKIVKEGTVRVEYEDKNTVHVPHGALRMPYDVECTFEDGLEFRETVLSAEKLGKDITGLPKETFSKGIGTTKNRLTEIDGKYVDKVEVRLFVTYSSFTQIGFTRIYTVLDANKPQHPQTLQNLVRDPQILRDGRVRPQCRKGCGGPYQLAVTTGIQPITEQKKPQLTVEFIKNTARKGDLAYIREVTLGLPDGIRLVSDDTTCHFSGNSVNRDILEDANKKLEEQNKKKKEEQQTQLSKPQLAYKCRFSVDNPPETLGFDVITATASYDVTLGKSTLIEVYQEKVET